MRDQFYSFSSWLASTGTSKSVYPTAAVRARYMLHTQSDALSSMLLPSRLLTAASAPLSLYPTRSPFRVKIPLKVD